MLKHFEVFLLNSAHYAFEYKNLLKQIFINKQIVFFLEFDEKVFQTFSLSLNWFFIYASSKC